MFGSGHPIVVIFLTLFSNACKLRRHKELYYYLNPTTLSQFRSYKIHLITFLN